MSRSTIAEFREKKKTALKGEGRQVIIKRFMQPMLKMNTGKTRIQK
jgi:hypothetical protein